MVSTVVSNSRLHRSVSGQASGLLIPPKNIRSPHRNQPDSPCRPGQKNTTVQRRGVGEGASTIWLIIWAFLTFFLLLLRQKDQTVRLYPAFLLTESLCLIHAIMFFLEPLTLPCTMHPELQKNRDTFRCTISTVKNHWPKPFVRLSIYLHSTVCFLNKWLQTKCRVTFDTSFWHSFLCPFTWYPRFCFPW